MGVHLASPRRSGPLGPALPWSASRGLSALSDRAAVFRSQKRRGRGEMDCLTRFLTRLRAFRLWMGSPAALLHQFGRLRRFVLCLRCRAANTFLL